MDIQQLKQKLLARSRSFGPALVVAVLAGTLGFYTLGQSGAATYAANSEAESGQLAGNASAGDGDGASAGASVKFDGVSSPTPPGVVPKPEASNTGVPSGAVLTAWSGATNGYDSVSDKVYENVNLPVPSAGYWTFAGNNLTFRNCRINGGVVFSGDNIRVEHCDIPSGVSLSGTNTVTLAYNNIHDWDDGIHITSDSGPVINVAVNNNYIHKPNPPCGAHSDGMQLLGVDGLTVTYNTIDMGKRLIVCNEDVLNGVFQIENTQGPNKNLSIDHNWLNGGGYTVRVYSCSNGRITNNKFGRDYFFGLTDIGDPACLVAKSGNVYEDTGAPVTF